MNWGKWIIVSFLLFAIFIGVLVMVCVRQDISLVSKNYYLEELDYQRQIDRLNNTERLDVKPLIEVVNDSLRITFSQFDRMQSGQLALFRPSDERSDRVFQLAVGQGQRQLISLVTVPAGMYKARMSWSMNDKEYYIENVIYH